MSTCTAKRPKGQQRKQAKKGKKGQPKPRAQRDSTLPKGQAGRILDRLILLEKVIGPGDVQQVLLETGCLDARRCTLTFEVVCWTMLAFGILTEMPIRQVFKAARLLQAVAPGQPLPEHDPTPSRSALCKARQRLGVAPLRL